MTLEPGQVIAHYRIDRKIGEGGMGEVYLAEDTRLDRKVALKVLPPSVAADPDRLARFEREAKAIAALNHPHIVTIYSVEEVRSGGPEHAGSLRLLTMEMVEGESLDGRIRPGGLPMEEVLEIGVALADALAAAHEKGIVHRDLKPANIMVTKEGRIKVLDFGLAKLSAGSTQERPLDPDMTSAPTDLPSRDDTLTRAGMVMGTAPYMSPEQLAGRPVDHRTDIFALGVVLYEVCTGRRPFDGDSSAELVSAIMRDVPASMSELREQVPARFERIVQHCLAKRLADRCSSALDLRGQLRSLQVELASGGQTTPQAPVPAASPSSGRRSRAPRTLLWGALGAAVVIAAAFALWLGGRDAGRHVAPDAVAARDASIAILPLATAAEEEDFASGIHDDLITQVSKIGALKVIGRTSVLGYKGTTRRASEIAADLGVKTILEGSVRHAGDRVRVNVTLIDAPSDTTIWSESYDREFTARSVFEIQTEIARRVATALEVALTAGEQRAFAAAPTEDLEAYQTYLKGLHLERLPDVEDVVAEAVASYGKAVDRDPAFAQAWARLAKAHLQMYWRGWDRSARRLESARLALDRAAALKPDLPETAVARGYYFYWGFRDYPKALAEFQEASRGLPNDASLVAVIAFIQRRMGMWDESLAGLGRAIELDPRNRYLLENLCSSYLVLRRRADAEEVSERLLEIDPSSTYPQVTRAAASLHLDGDPGPIRGLTGAHRDLLYLLDAHLIARDFSSATLVAESWPDEGYESQLSLVPRPLARGLVLYLAGDRAGATTLLQTAARELEERVEANPADPRIHASLGLTYSLMGEPDAALRAGRRAVELLPYTTDAMDAGSFVADLARIYAILGRKQEAVQQLDRYLSHPGFIGTGYIERHPVFDPLQGDPAFEAVLKKHRPAS